MDFKVFLDTNIFLDHLLNRSEHSKNIIRICEQREVTGFASSASFFTLAYYVKKANLDPKGILMNYAGFIEIIPTEKITLYSAFSSDFMDLEDAFQYYTALAEKGMDYFITQNIKDFRHALDNLPVLNPERFLKEL
jgi:predicted nucleic acid-binding protein